MRAGYILFFSMVFWYTGIFAQANDTLRGTQPGTTVQKDTAKNLAQKAQIPVNVSTATSKVSTADSISKGLSPNADTNHKIGEIPDLNTRVGTNNVSRTNIIAQVLNDNKFINSKGTPQFFIIEVRDRNNTKDIFFYVMCGLLLILGIFKTFYSHYFSTLFTVYFNTSLRQTQLSEQLLQAKLPSFILNIFFVLMAGIFCWLIFLNVLQKTPESPFTVLQICLGAVAIVYITKYCFLKFIGWISGFSDTANHYIFIIFLVNKLLAIVLIPFVILIAFASPEWMNVYITLSLLSIGVLLLSRYIKSYGLLRQKFTITPFHFIVFFLGAEFIPLLIIYKVIFDYILV